MHKHAKRVYFQGHTIILNYTIACKYYDICLHSSLCSSLLETLATVLQAVYEVELN